MTIEGRGNWNRAARKSGGNRPFVMHVGPGRDKGTVYFTYEGNGPDEHGRRFFAMDWWDEGQRRWRGQVFHAKPEPYIEGAKKRGLNAEER